MVPTLVVNLYGAPGSGKSTGAAYVFALLKMRGIDAELVTEFAKDKTWEQNFTALNDEYYVFGKQHYRLSRLNGKVRVVITDSPLLLATLYAHDDSGSFRAMVHEAYRSFRNLDVMVTRDKPYNPNGRNQTAAESDEIAERCLKMLAELNIAPLSIRGNQTEYDRLVKAILACIGEKEEEFTLQGVNSPSHLATIVIGENLPIHDLQPHTLYLDCSEIHCLARHLGVELKVPLPWFKQVDTLNINGVVFARKE